MIPKHNGYTIHISSEYPSTNLDIVLIKEEKAYVKTIMYKELFDANNQEEYINKKIEEWIEEIETRTNNTSYNRNL